MNDELNQPQAQTSTQPQDDRLGDGGYKALQAERERARRLEAETKSLQAQQDRLKSELTSKYEIDIQALQAVQERERSELVSEYDVRLAELQKIADERDYELKQLQSAMVSKKITEDFTKAIGEELVNPQMANLLMGEFANSLALDRDGNTVVQSGDKIYPLDALKQHCKETYPELFRPPSNQSGIGLNQFMNGTPQVKVQGYVSAKDEQGFLRNLDAIAKGSVKVVDN